mgnify:FL=1
MIFFSDRIEKFIPPKKGKSHILRIIRELIEFEPQGRGTDIRMALKFCTNAVKKRSIAFLISDFLSDNFEDALKVAGKKHDLVAIRIFDKMEMELPDVGLVRISDPESGSQQWVNTSSSSVRQIYRNNARIHQKRLTDIFKRSGIDNTPIETGENYIKPLMNLFRKRELRG